MLLRVNIKGDVFYNHNIMSAIYYTVLQFATNMKRNKSRGVL